MKDPFPSKDPNSYLFYIKLNPGISKLNLISFLLMTFVNWTCVNFIYSFITQILSNPFYYNLDKNKVPDIYGDVCMYAEVASII